VLDRRVYVAFLTREIAKYNLKDCHMAQRAWRDIIAESLLATLADFAGPPAVDRRAYIEAIIKVRDAARVAAGDDDENWETTSDDVVDS